MTTATQNELYPSGWAVAHTSVVGRGEVMRGDRLRADDWRVQEFGESIFIDANVNERFWPDPATTVEGWAEKAQREAAEKERAAFEDAARQNKVTLSIADTMVCHTDFLGRVDGAPATIKRGSKALASSDAVTQAPENWKAA